MSSRKTSYSPPKIEEQSGVNRKDASGRNIKEYEFPYLKPPERTCGEKLKLAIWDPQKRELFGRTKKRWGVVFLFYLVFFSGLAVFFTICMYGLLQSIDPKRPTYLLDSSIIGTNPGIGFRPMDPTGMTISGVIRYMPTNSSDVKVWTDYIDKFLLPYKTDGGQGQREACDYERGPTIGKSCSFPLDNLGPCSPNNGYGYNKSQPCVFIKLNRIYSWVPDYYKSVDELPDDMPVELKNQIANITDPSDLGRVWVSCKGETPMDREVIGPLEYYPIQGFPSYYYPYVNQDGYLSPIVAVQFKRPALNVLINVECRLWAKNIFYAVTARGREGSGHFQLIIDDEKSKNSKHEL